MTRDSIQKLRELAAQCPATRFRPAALFVAHCGVLTVVFEGFDAGILDLKDAIDRAIPDLEEEHEGSMWPKVTLAVLKENQRLNEHDVNRLRDVADEWDAAIRSSGAEVVVNQLLAVEYGCRSLEIRRQSIVLPLRSGSGESSEPAPPPHHSRFVRSVLSQFSRERLGEYTAAIDREGHREDHYRKPAIGWSLVADVAPDQLPFAFDIIKSVEQALPGSYAAMAPVSWHLTVRSLDRDPAESRPAGSGRA